MKLRLKFRCNGELVEGQLEVFATHWSFVSDNKTFRQYFPYGASSFMQYVPSARQQKTAFLTTLTKTINAAVRSRVS